MTIKQTKRIQINKASFLSQKEYFTFILKSVQMEIVSISLKRENCNYSLANKISEKSDLCMQIVYSTRI